MTIEQKLAYIQKAIEMGAEIQIKFFEIRNQDEAEKAANELAKVLGVNVSRDNSVDQSAHWLDVDKAEEGISTTFYYDLTNKEALA